MMFELEHENYLIGIQTLSEGYLSVTLIDPQQVEQAIETTVQELQAKFSNHYV